MNNQNSTGALMRRLWREAIHFYKGRLALALVFMAVMAAATAMSAWLMEPVVNDILIAHDRDMLWLVGGALRWRLHGGPDGHLVLLAPWPGGVRAVAAGRSRTVLGREYILKVTGNTHTGETNCMVMVEKCSHYLLNKPFI